MAGSAIGGEVVLPRLDMVFGLATGAIEPFVEVLGAAAFQVGDNEAGIGSFGPGFNPCDDALYPAPALGGIVELHEPRTLPRFDATPAFASLKRSAVLFSSAVTWRRRATLGARPKSQSTRFARHQSNTSGAA